LSVTDHGYRLQPIVKEQEFKLRGSRNSRPRTPNKSCSLKTTHSKGKLVSRV
jgi:hypothetical protein